MRRKLIENRSIAVSACFMLCIQFSLLQNAVGQSNYASHANNVDYLGKGLPEEATLDGKVSKQTKNCVFLNIQITTINGQKNIKDSKLNRSSVYSNAAVFNLNII